MFDALLRMQLGPIVERLVEMETQLEDLYRRAESFCRIGVCQEVDAASNTCKVSHGELLTPAIRFFNPSAGAQTETRIPSVGEQCLLLNYGGGGHGCAVQHVRQKRLSPTSVRQLWAHDVGYIVPPIGQSSWLFTACRTVA